MIKQQIFKYDFLLIFKNIDKYYSAISLIKIMTHIALLNNCFDSYLCNKNSFQFTLKLQFLINYHILAIKVN